VSEEQRIPESLRELLAAVAGGRLSVDEAGRRLAELGVSAVGDYALLDLGRARRKQVPEIIYAPGKTAAQLVEIVTAFVRGAGAVLCSKTSPEQAAAVRQKHRSGVIYDERSRVLVARGAHYQPPVECGTAGVLAAGTGDVPVAEEAAAVCRLMGVRVLTAYDVGVAGLHRLLAAVGQLQEADAVVVVAGMEGALASVVGGLVRRPGIAVPTSVGYGANFGGLSALLTMLNTCAAGVAVVNIDNGFGAGYFAHIVNVGGRDNGG